MKIYSNQLVSENVSLFPSDGIQTTKEEWSFIYDSEIKKIIKEPTQGSMLIYSPLTLVVANSLKECKEYISTNELLYSEYLENN
jgi:hypothetical protein